MNMGAADLNIGQAHNDVDLYPLLAKGKGVQTTQLKSNPKKPRNVPRQNNSERRSFAHVVFLQVMIRLRFAVESLFGLKAFFLESSGYRSFMRPKNMPEVDYPTKFAIRFLQILSPILRSVPVFVFFLAKIRVMHVLNWIYIKLNQRVARIMKESNVNWETARKIPIPEFDWKNKTPEEFYNTFVKAPHPVVLRGYLQAEGQTS